MPNNSRLSAIALLLLTLIASTAGHAKPLNPDHAINADTELYGNFQQGGIVFGRTPPGTSIRVHKRQLTIDPQGRFLFGLGRDQKSPVRVTITPAQGPQRHITLDIRPREYRIQRINGLPKGKVSGFSKADLKRIRADVSAARKARKLNEPRTDWDTDWIWPVTGPISGVYGSQRILNGQPRRPHFGVDIARPTGTPVRAPASGKITLVRNMFFSGNTIVLDHGENFSSSFLHLSKALVKVGDIVKQGDIIGEIGATGRVTGPHLDWRMNLGKQRVDPTFLVPPMKQVLKQQKAAKAAASKNP